VKLVPNEQVVEVDEFEATDPALRGETTITYTLADADGGTDVPAIHAPPCRRASRGSRRFLVTGGDALHCVAADA
jgi:hypothetical protein